MAQGHGASTASDVARIVAVKEQIELLQNRLSQIQKTNPELALQVQSFTPVFNMALFAKDVYFNTSIPELMPKGYERLVEDKPLARVGLGSGDLVSAESGYFGALYGDAKNGRHDCLSCVSIQSV